MGTEFYEMFNLEAFEDPNVCKSLAIGDVTEDPIRDPRILYAWCGKSSENHQCVVVPTQLYNLKDIVLAPPKSQVEKFTLYRDVKQFMKHHADTSALPWTARAKTSYKTFEARAICTLLVQYHAPTNSYLWQFEYRDITANIGGYLDPRESCHPNTIGLVIKALNAIIDITLSMYAPNQHGEGSLIDWRTIVDDDGAPRDNLFDDIAGLLWVMLSDHAKVKMSGGLNHGKF